MANDNKKHFWYVFDNKIVVAALLQSLTASPLVHLNYTLNTICSQSAGLFKAR